jgi:hypothetical protein
MMSGRSVRRFGGVSAFSPADIAGLQGWWKADSLSLSDGDPVATWEDSSGNSRDLTEGTTKPTYETGILNSLPVVRFDGTDDKIAFVSGSTWLSGDNLTIFCVYVMRGEPDAAGRYISVVGAVGELDYDGPDGLIFFHNTGAGAEEQTMTNTVVQTTQTSSLDTPSLETFRLTGGTFTHRHNGAAADTDPTGALATQAWREFRLGGSGRADEYTQADMAEILVYDSSLSDTDRDAVEAYLADKWGL